MANISTELSFVLAFGAVTSFFILLLALGMPDTYSILGTFDLAVLGTSFIAIGVACTVITGLACVATGAIFSLGTLAVYIGAGALAPTLTSYALIKALIMTPIMISFTYIQGRLARGGG